MVQFSWNWNVPVMSDHDGIHLKSIGTGLATTSVCVKLSALMKHN